MLAQALEALEKEARMDKLSNDQQSTLAESFKSLGQQFDKVLDKPNALEGEYKNDVEILVSSDKKTASDDDGWLDVEAYQHPIEGYDPETDTHERWHDGTIDRRAMEAEEWYDVGPGNFEDPRKETMQPGVAGDPVKT